MNNKYIVMDIENPSKYCNSVCAICMLVIEDFKVTSEIYSLINPEDEFNDRNSHICGITPDMVIDKPTIKEFYEDNKKYFDGSYIFMGHNAHYDLTVLSKALYSYDIELNELKYICTWELSEKYMTNLKSHKLCDILDSLDYVYDAHNALADSYACLYLYDYLNDKYNDNDIFSEDIKTYKYRRKRKDIIRGEIREEVREEVREDRNTYEDRED